jgi:putative tryptophan/tyrosine transport system substrate-binding protein
MRRTTIRRRDILTGAAALSTAMISPAAASRRVRMGWLSASTPSTLPGLALLLTYLSALGWRAGETLEVVGRQAEGDVSQLQRLAAEIVAAHPDVIACTGSAEVSALSAATSEIPIVFHFVADPLALGIVNSLARPTGNITGIAVAAQLLEGKRLQLLVDLLGPTARKFVWLGNSKNPSVNSLWADAAATAAHLKVDIVRVDAGGADAIEPAFDAIAIQNANGVVVPYDFLFTAQKQRIITLAAERRLPTIYASRTLALEGGLLSYGPDLRENLRHGATYIDRILKGAPPSDLPVYQPSRLELILNLKAAKALGLTVPPAILLRADEVIE